MKNWIIELLQYRELLVAFSIKEIKIRYKQTLLGFGWAILQPAALTLIFSLVFGMFLQINSSNVPYPIFAYSALLPWTFFTNAINFGSMTVVSNGNLVTKVYFPREIMPLSSVAAAIFDFLMAGIIFLVMMFFYNTPVTINLLFLLLILPSLALLTTGFSFFFAAINVLYRDVRFVLPILLQMLLYITPIIYSIDQVPEKYRIYILLNPLSGLIESFRQVTVMGVAPSSQLLAYCCGLSVIVFLGGYFYFKKKEKVFADVI